jgi:hypothetical protein
VFRRIFGGGSMEEPLDREKGTTPARRAISCSPSCQCIASAALQGIAISSATFAHISALNLYLFSVHTTTNFGLRTSHII